VYRLFDQIAHRAAERQFVVSGPDDIAAAVRHFFSPRRRPPDPRRAAHHEAGWRSYVPQTGGRWRASSG
jgi:hypothetical protein